MLTNLREGAKSGILKYFLLAFIAVAVLGLVFIDMSGAFRDNIGSNSVASVGDTEISAITLREQMARAERRAEMGDMPEELRQQLALRIVDQQVRERLFLVESRDLDLILPDKTAANMIRKQLQPMMDNGLSAEEALAQQLRAQGMSESQFLQVFKQDQAMRQVLRAVTAGGYAPNQMVKTALKFQNQKRTGRYASIPYDHFAGKIKTPDEKTLKTFYDENQKNYMTPEYREISYLIFDENNVPAVENISDEELREVYNDRIEQYTTPAGRVIDQVVFDSAEEAEKIVADVFDTQELRKAVEELPSDSYVLLEDELITPGDTTEKIENAAFDTPVGDIAGPIETNLGWIVIKVREERPEETQDFAQIRDDLKKSYTLEQEENRLYDVANQVDNMLVSGMKLSDIASEYNFNVYQTPLIQADGKTKDGNSAEILQKDFAEDLLAKVFALGNNEIPPLLETDNGIFVAYQASRIVSAAPKPFNEIKAQVTDDWQKRELRQRAMNLAETFVQDIKDGSSFDAVAEDHNIQTGTLPAMTGQDASQFTDVPQPVLKNLFNLANVGDVAKAPTQNGLYIVQLDAVSFPEETGTEKQMTAMRETVAEQIRTELMIQYETQLREKFDVNISRNAIKRNIQPAESEY